MDCWIHSIEMELGFNSLRVAVAIVSLQTVLSKTTQKSITLKDELLCEHFVQNCVPCLNDSQCYCHNATAMVDMKCSKWNQDEPGCFEIFDAANESFSCKLNTAHVTSAGGSAVQFCRTFYNATDLSNANYRTWISTDYYKSKLADFGNCTQQQTGNQPQNNDYLMPALISLCAVQTVLIVVLMIMNCKTAKRGAVCKEKTQGAQEMPMRCEEDEIQCENDMYGKI